MLGFRLGLGLGLEALVMVIDMWWFSRNSRSVLGKFSGLTKKALSVCNRYQTRQRCPGVNCFSNTCSFDHMCLITLITRV